MKAHRNRAFTLVEILIVVIILGVLAAIVVPQFNVATEDAQTSAIESQLQTIRGQFELFRAQQSAQVPDLVALQWAPLVDGGYFTDAPLNPKTNSTVIVAGTGPADGGADDGWVWDSSTSKIYAALFDEDTGTWLDPGG